LSTDRVRGATAPRGAVALPGGLAAAVLGTLSTVYVAALWIQAAVYLPKEVVVLGFLGAATAFRRLRVFVRDWAPLLLPLFLMDVLRALAWRVVVVLDRPVVVRWPIEADRALFGAVPTLALQAWLHPTPALHWYDVAFAILHGSHFVAFLVVALLIWVWRPQAFRGYAVAVVLTAYAGLVGYYLVPTAPPWLAAVQGALPPVPRILLSVDYVQIPRFLLLGFDTNPVAAMPSLHAAFAVLVAGGLRIVSPVAGRVAYAYPVALGLALVYGGEHYVADLLVGYALGAAGFWAGLRAGGRGVRRAPPGAG
jgi:membrane-associated phospholipid phosphatase